MEAVLNTTGTNGNPTSFQCWRGLSVLKGVGVILGIGDFGPVTQDVTSNIITFPPTFVATGRDVSITVGDANALIVSGSLFISPKETGPLTFTNKVSKTLSPAITLITTTLPADGSYILGAYVVAQRVTNLTSPRNTSHPGPLSDPSADYVLNVVSVSSGIATVIGTPLRYSLDGPEAPITYRPVFVAGGGNKVNLTAGALVDNYTWSGQIFIVPTLGVPGTFTASTTPNQTGTLTTQIMPNKDGTYYLRAYVSSKGTNANETGYQIGCCVSVANGIARVVGQRIDAIPTGHLINTQPNFMSDNNGLTVSLMGGDSFALTWSGRVFMVPPSII